MILLSIFAMMALAGLILQQNRLIAAQARAGEAERLAAARGRCLLLAGMELKDIAATMVSCRYVLVGQGGNPAGFCRSTRKGLEGPVQQLMQLSDGLSEAACQAAGPAMEEAEVQLGPIIDAVIGRVDSHIAPGRRHWKVDPALRGLTVKADRTALAGALLALLRRAASHSKDDDLVALRWVLASETVAIVVEDEGDGLTLHDPVVEAANAAGGRALDLGLSLARSVATAHGGDIRLEATPGIGARTWLTLPRTRLLEAA